MSSNEYGEVRNSDTTVRRQQLPLSGPYVAPRTPTERKLEHIWRKTLGIDQVGVRDRYEDLGGDVLRAAVIFSEIEQMFAVEISTLADAPTIEQLARKIDALTSTAQPMLHGVQIAEEQPPLFLVHGLPQFMPLASAVAARLGTDRPFYLLNIGGHEGGLPPIERMREEIGRIRPRGALRLGGAREGALPALALARALSQEGRQIGPVILVDPPSLMGGEPVPAAFSDPAEVILTPQAAIQFFHPQMPWQKLLCGPRIVHVLPWNQEDLFQSGCEDVARLLKFILEQVPTFEVFTQGPTE